MRKPLGSPFRKYAKYALALTCAVMLTACDKISQANYEKIQNDMTLSQVRDILGEPTESSAVNLGLVSGTSATWKSAKGGTVTIQFINDKVTVKNYSK